ncbi:serine/threonine protein phosphatase [Mesorhizobium sp. Root552]|uniref:lipopolysaccharide kinase InaA family protein n=1 Tax=Mesorhizobium sp. Root552 TaxID=1736555 RepID=UPI000700EA8A|nr:RIO1 family regulatory kinase/ATPase [Mesorhizobium sp. Root552]KQZ19444.1 serine/threonine protein phosphatase [Mesorhizobium sp. Root552]
MTEETEIRTDMLSADGLATLLRLIVAQASLRVSRASVDSRLVWIKRYDVERMPLAKRLHSLVSPLLPVFLRSSPTTGSAEAIAREMRKLASFRAAGFAVPDVVFSNQSVLVLSDVGEVVQKTLMDSLPTDPARHDDLLIDLARALGEAHRAGLCHGRPHPRDMFLRDGRIGFLDFEEEPEAVMPLPMAQARDAWLLFLQISPRAALPETQARALAAYRAAAPLEIIPALRTLTTFFARAMAPLRLVPNGLIGKDGRRAIDATDFLSRALGKAPPSNSKVSMTGRERPRGQS